MTIKLIERNINKANIFSKELSTNQAKLTLGRIVGVRLSLGWGVGVNCVSCGGRSLCEPLDQMKIFYRFMMHHLYFINLFICLFL
jgi:hypothetical protein